MMMTVAALKTELEKFKDDDVVQIVPDYKLQVVPTESKGELASDAPQEAPGEVKGVK